MKVIVSTDGFLTAMEAARRLNVSDTAVRKRIANGSLQANKHGREWQIPLAEVERLLNESTDDSEPNRPNPNPNGSQGSEAQSECAEIQHLTELVGEKDNQVQSLQEQLTQCHGHIESLTRALDHAQQLHALAQKNIGALTEQLDDSRQMIEDMRQRKTVWQRLKGVFVSETG